MARVSSAAKDAAHAPEPAQQSAAELLLIDPSRIVFTPSNLSGRPGPFPSDEQKAIDGLSFELSGVGQIVPIVVGPPDPDGFYPLIDGRRRVLAAKQIKNFRLKAVIGHAQTPAEAQRHAIHANMKRRGLTALQMAHLIANLRREHAWEGTKEVAKYLGVSRAYVSEHDKLLRKPAGMSDATYAELLALLQAGRMGAQTAFYTLTHVEPEQAAAVVTRAEEIAQDEPEAQKSASRTRKASETSPRSANARETASHEAAKPSSESKTTPPKPKVEKKHVARAARELGAVRFQTQRTLPELRLLFGKLTGLSGVPDIMRNFVSLIANSWWNGNAKDDEVVAQWREIAKLIPNNKPAQREAKRTKHKAKK